MRLPWISREHHEAVTAAKDALIRSLETQNAVLAERLCEPVKVSVELPKDFAVIQPALIRRPRPQKEPEQADVDFPKTIEQWAAIDENDPVALAKLAAHELGPRYTAFAQGQTVRRLRQSIRDAKKKMAHNRTERGSVSTIVTRRSEIPADVAADIAAAERG